MAKMEFTISIIVIKNEKSVKRKYLNIQTLIEKSILYAYSWSMNCIGFCQVAKIEFSNKKKNK